MLSVWVIALWKHGTGFKRHSRADCCETSQVSSLCSWQSLQDRPTWTEPRLGEFRKGRDDNVETWAVSKAIYSMWEELSRLLASEEVQPSTIASSAWGALVVIHHHSQACLWNYSSAKLHWTWKYQNRRIFGERNLPLSTTLQLVASRFRYKFFLNQIWVLKASISLIPFLLNRRNPHCFKSICENQVLDKTFIGMLV